MATRHVQLTGDRKSGDNVHTTHTSTHSSAICSTERHCVRAPPTLWELAISGGSLSPTPLQHHGHPQSWRGSDFLSWDFEICRRLLEPAVGLLLGWVGGWVGGQCRPAKTLFSRERCSGCTMLRCCGLQSLFSTGVVAPVPAMANVRENPSLFLASLLAPGQCRCPHLLTAR
jgi:hypothetical protein